MCKSDPKAAPSFATCLGEAWYWLPDHGQALCEAKEFQQVKDQVSCITTTQQLLYKHTSLGEVDSKKKAQSMCKSDPKGAPSFATCLGEAWYSLPDHGQALCEAKEKKAEEERLAA